MKVCLGGTFDFIHEGHASLLKKAFEIGDEVVIGISSDELVSRMGKEAKKYEERKRNLEKFLESRGWRARVEMLHDAYGTTLQEDFDAMVVSPETRKMAEKINERRRELNMKEIEIVEIPYVLAEDGIPIASKRIRNGEIEGRRRMKPLRVCIATRNEIKVEAVKKIFSEIFSSLKVEYNVIPYETKKQPLDKEIMEGAIRRAEEAVKKGDYGVGIEAGVREEGGIYFVEQYVAVADKIGYITHGKSPSFQCPEWVIEEIRRGNEMKDVIPFSDEKERKRGAVWYFSRKMDRKQITEIGILMAMIPRMKGMRKA